MDWLRMVEMRLRGHGPRRAGAIHRQDEAAMNEMLGKSCRNELAKKIAEAYV
jgi:hypothetical protein